MFNHALLAATGVGVVVAIVAVLIVFMLLLVIMTRIKTCPSDKVLVVHGKIGKNKDGTYRSAKCMHGGVTLVVPFLQKYTFLDLTPLSISVDLKSALSKQNIRIDVPSIFTVGISTDPAIMQNAAERLLGLTLQNISELAKDIIFGQLRLVIATMDIEEINSDRDKFLDAVSRNVEGELKKIGLKLINVNVTDISDESGYITALGKEAAAKAINDAKVSVAEEDRKGSVGQANAKMQERISVAEAESAAITGENKSKAEIAQSKAILREKEAESLKIAVSAEKIQEAKALEESYAAQREAEVARAEREKATREADIIVAAEIEKKKMEIDAEAQAEHDRILAPWERKGTNLLKYNDFEDPIRQIMDYYAKYRRNMAGMRLALEKLALVESYTDRVVATNNHELMRLHEAFDLLELCRAHLEACLQRKESGRGMYQLSDYPEKDPELAKGLVLTRKDGAFQFGWTE